LSAGPDDALTARVRVLALTAELQRTRLANDAAALREQTRPAALVHTLWQRATPQAVGLLVPALVALVWAARRRQAASGRSAPTLASALALLRLGLQAARWWRGN